MPGWEISAVFFLTALLLGMSPGPDIIFVLTQSAVYGARPGLAIMFGLATGLCFQTLAAALGLAALFQAYPAAFTLLRALGAAYLCWLAFLALKADPARAEDGGAEGRKGYAKYYLRGVIMNVTNPKVTIFFLAFLPQFFRPDAGSMAFQACYFGFLFIAAALIVFSAAAFLGGRLAAVFNNYPKIQLWINRMAAAVFIGLAAALAFID